MINIEILRDWVLGAEDDVNVAIDDGGLSLVILDDINDPTGEYIEIGGIPLPEEE